jgi:signal transduction histidine kinase
MMLTKLKRLLETFTFRLALVYVGLFSLSVVLLFAFIFVSAERYLEAQTADNLRTRYTQLLNEYRDNGSAGVEERIAELIRSDEEGTEIYLLINREGEKLAGNMESWPKFATEEGEFNKDGAWIHFFIEGSRTTPNTIEVKAIGAPLSKWRTVLVGQSMQNQNRVKQTVIQAFWTSLLVTVIMAFVGAFVITGSVVRRINIINRSAHQIMHGQLSARIPTNKGGDEFDALSRNLNQMLDKIEDLLKSLSDFANNIAHDLRTPMSRIIARTETGLRKLHSDSEAASLLTQNVGDMQELIATFNAILRISELEASKDAHALVPLELGRLLEKMVEFYEPYALDKDITLTSDFSGKLWVSGEKHLLTQAFANLIDNAIKFSNTGGNVQVAGHTFEGNVIITIADHGPGIPEDMREKVFEKFYRLEQSRNSKGNGLGLSLVAAILRIHNTTITLADNAPGLKVALTFPALQVEADSDDFTLI